MKGKPSNNYVGGWDEHEIAMKSFEDKLSLKEKRPPALDFSFSPQVSDDEDEWAGFEMELDRKKHEDGESKCHSTSSHQTLSPIQSPAADTTRSLDDMNSDGWKLAFTNDRRPYFYHELTKETTWKAPGSVPKPSPASDTWREAYTDQGYLYYYNSKTRETTWKKPMSNQTDDQQLFCLFCGLQCHRNDLSRHLERCTKSENQAAAATVIKAVREWLKPVRIPFDEYASTKSIDFDRRKQQQKPKKETVRKKDPKPRRSTLMGSYQDHIKELVLCQYCNRKFAPSGAERHIEICKNVENRPKAKK